jgi:hypothetical protein
MRTWVVRFLFGGLVALVSLSSFAVAATPAPTAPQGTATTNTSGSSGQGLEISPPVIELAADPGQTVTASIRVRNVTAGQLIAKGKADDFGAGTDESGQPKLLLDETGATRFSLKYWVSGVPDLRLAPQELKTTTVIIKVPQNAEPGGHFGVIRFTAVPPDLEGTGVALSASVGTLVLLRVSGPITEKLSVAELSSWRGLGTKAAQETTFFEHGPVGFVVRLKNDGSVHEKATGTIDVTNMFGGKTASVKVNEKGGNVLPDSIRRFEQSLDKKQLFGLYTAKLAMTYSNGKKLEGNLSFWVIPWKLLLLLLVGLVALVFLLKLSIRRYNEHIIAMARRR